MTSLGRIKQHRKTGTYFIVFRHKGRAVWESVARLMNKPAREVTEQDARRVLRLRMRDVFGDRYVGPKPERLSVAELLTTYEEHCRIKGAKTLYGIVWRCQRISAALGMIKAVNLDAREVQCWVAQMQGEGYAPGTINTMVMTLRAALHHACRVELLARVPYFPVLCAQNARQGFFEREQVEKIIGALTDPLNDIVRFAYLTGWRQSEILGLHWSQVDRADGVIRLPDSKNGKPRSLPIFGDLSTLIEVRWAMRGKEGFVFHRRGHPIHKDTLKAAWRCARAACGLENKLFHDLRRTAVRDLIRAGVTENVAMKISGHQSTSIFRRYDIVSTADQREAMRKMEEYRAGGAK